MFLLFSSDSSNDNLFIAVIAGDSALITGQWIHDASSIQDSITLTDLPTMRFSANPQSDFQICEWIRTRAFLDRTVTSGWQWGPSTAPLPPTPPQITRYFQIAVANSQTYICTGFSAFSGPILTPTVYNNREFSDQITLLPGHLMQIARTNPIPPIVPQTNNARGHKRKHPTGDC
jgi:hypothetical protein